MATINKDNEAFNLLGYINKDIRNGFIAEKRPDSSLLVSYTGYEQEFDMSLEFSHEFKCWMFDSSPYSVRGHQPSISYHKGQIGFITIALAKYNVALEKRLSK